MCSLPAVMFCTLELFACLELEAADIEMVVAGKGFEAETGWRVGGRRFLREGGSVRRREGLVGRSERMEGGMG